MGRVRRLTFTLACCPDVDPSKSCLNVKLFLTSKVQILIYSPFNLLNLTLGPFLCLAHPFTPWWPIPAAASTPQGALGPSYNLIDLEHRSRSCCPVAESSKSHSVGHLDIVSYRRLTLQLPSSWILRLGHNLRFGLLAFYMTMIPSRRHCTTRCS